MVDRRAAWLQAYFYARGLNSSSKEAGSKEGTDKRCENFADKVLQAFDKRFPEGIPDSPMITQAVGSVMDQIQVPAELRESIVARLKFMAKQAIAGEPDASDSDE